MTDGTPSRKRPRPVVSCLRCRGKKLKCDRVVPCQNCSKAGCPTECAFHPGLGEPDSKHVRPRDSQSRDSGVPASSAHRSQPGNPPTPAPTAAPASDIGLIVDLRQRLARVEDVFRTLQSPVHAPIPIPIPRDAASRETTPTVPPRAPSAAPPAPPHQYVGTLVAKGRRTRYHGQNSRISLLNQFPDAKAFIERCTKDSAVVALAREVQCLQIKARHSVDNPESLLDRKVSDELTQMRAALPAKDVCGHLIEVYLLNMEKTLRILYVPDFASVYSMFSVSPSSDITQRAAFVPLLTAVLAVGWSLTDPSFRLEHPALGQYLQTEAIPLVRAWMQKLTRKPRTEFMTLQVEALLVLGQQLRLEPPEDLWRATGTLVRSAMVLGLHLDSPVSPGLTPGEIEIRRRLWITIVEMDLQASIAAGMPVALPVLDPLHLPANLNDQDFIENASTLPPARPLHEWTDALALVTLATSLPHRLRAVSLAQSTPPGRDLGLIAAQGRRVEECLRQVPPCLSLQLNHLPCTADSPTRLLNRVLLDLYLRRPLLCLYRPVVMGENRPDRLFLEIQRVCLDSSLVVLSHQDQFDPRVADLDVFPSSRYWDIFQLLCRNDISCAALSVCAYMRLSTAQQTAAQLEFAPGIRTTTHTKASLTRVLENTLEGLTRTIDAPGSNMKDVLLLAVALPSVRAQGSAEQKNQWMEQGAVKALSACRQHLLAIISELKLPPNNAGDAFIESICQPPEDPSFPPIARLQSPDFMADPAGQATEFINFERDLFSFENGSFLWNL
ncbi:hypothetical protein BO71DRAFT_416569 [Aspergillus ellipticus CBS 707.79]|uniref:Zn(2)-C6 fungal-type domain-containing protein n=1 Tax=Aspergillus ellipticus CBS 707.79 TaxID=1448320 RepID=A0A319F0W3_9EURO|nr:hypothetical protein BO71DRAFT_416569 [Aspergillus ellipticus CBS 707.79]